MKTHLAWLLMRRHWKQEGLLALLARLPDYLINLTALVLPWLELVVGLFLVLGLFREGSVFIGSCNEAGIRNQTL